MSDLVILAEVVEAGKEYKIVVKEVFKGKVKSDTLKGKATDQFGSLLSNCIFYPHKNGTYLIYADKITELDGKAFIQIHQCAATRSLDLKDYTYALPSEIGKEEIINQTESWISYLRKK